MIQLDRTLETEAGTPMTTDAEKAKTTAEALNQWREAERTAAVARRGKLAAQVAVRAAEEASEAALQTATAAKQALEAATLAEASAKKTAASARVVVESTQLDMADADSEAALAEVSEADAREQYRLTSERVSQK